MFDPKVSGYARSSDTKPAPVRGVRVLVNTLLDWTMIVSPAPTTITRYPVTQPKYLQSSGDHFHNDSSMDLLDWDILVDPILYDFPHSFTKQGVENFD